MSKSKKSVIIIISAICAALIIALGICVGQFYSSTTASIEEYCKENSFKGAESFDINKSSELDGYVLCVSKDGDDSKGQELFIFYEKPFGAIKNTNRYTLEYQSNESGAQLVGSYLFKPRGSDESRMIFYSNNNEKATDFEYSSEYNLDGKDCKNTVSYSFGENDCVIAISNPLQNEEAVKSASLKRVQRLFIHIDFKFKLGKSGCDYEKEKYNCYFGVFDYYCRTERRDNIFGYE